MSTRPLRNAGGVPFLVLEGFFVVRAGLMPDGDTIGFAAKSTYNPGPVDTNVPVDSAENLHKNIRLQSIDAPEKSQPLGATSRNALLRNLGFDPLALGLSDIDFTANGPTVKKQGWLITHKMDGNQRPLGYVFNANPGFSHGDIVSADDVRNAIKSSANYAQAKNGWAYPAFYDNTDETHAVLFQETAGLARAEGMGVWKTDATTEGFIPTKSALGIGGTLIYPKFYRRVEKWLAATPDAQAFIDWLKTQDDGKKLVQGARPSPVPLWKLFDVVSSSKVAVPYDVGKLWFSE